MTIGPVKADARRRGPVDARTETPCTVGGSVPATLSLSLGAAASFGAFTPGIDREVHRVDDRRRDQHGWLCCADRVEPDLLDQLRLLAAGARSRSPLSAR